MSTTPVTQTIKEIELAAPKHPYTVDDSAIKRAFQRIEFYPAIWARPKPIRPAIVLATIVETSQGIVFQPDSPERRNTH